jgi:23S rRNA pseudouridine2605 synthase
MSPDPAKAVRVQKVIAQAGLASRREAEAWIREGLVTVNGEVVELGHTMTPGVDELRVDNTRVRLEGPARSVLYALYKPKNCITTLKDPQGRVTIRQFFPKTSVRLFPVGRLDYDAEGLILLTNNGDWSQRLMHPRHKVWKGYFVKVWGVVPESALMPLRQGPTLQGRAHQPTRIRILHHRNDKTWLEVSLREGTNHQIKKMFQQISFPVLKIKRFRIGSLNLGEMRPGESRLLTAEEQQALLNLAQELPEHA